MKQTLALVLGLVSMACGPSAGPDAGESAAPSTDWVLTEGIATPESIYADPASGFIFSSQMDGEPTGRDGNGRIVKLRADGTLVDARWATELHAPKGLRACDGTLWTADLDTVVGFAVATGAEVARVTIPTAQFLNDVACAGRTVYVSDMMANRIYTIADGAVAVFAEGDALEYPNGLLIDGNRLIVGSWGQRPREDFSTEVPGRLYAIDLATRARTVITPEPFANIDGVESDGSGGYLVSDYLAGKILRVSADGRTRLVRQFGPGSADIGFEPGTRTLLVPHMTENRLAGYVISDALD
jgi:sugar lactone lactonase YvrE